MDSLKPESYPILYNLPRWFTWFFFRQWLLLVFIDFLRLRRVLLFLDNLKWRPFMPGMPSFIARWLTFVVWRSRELLDWDWCRLLLFVAVDIELLQLREWHVLDFVIKVFYLGGHIAFPLLRKCELIRQLVWHRRRNESVLVGYFFETLQRIWLKI